MRTPYLCSFATRSFGKMRDPARPLKPTTPFFSYLQDYRQNAAKSEGHKDVVKNAAAKWKNLNSGEKKPYEDSYATKKTKYDAEFSKYRDTGALDAWKRDPARPKKPLTGFMRFVQQYRADKGKGMKVTEVTKEAAKAYKGLPQSQKDAYDTAYKKEKVEYDIKMAAYKKSGSEQAWKEKTGIAAEEKKAAEKVKKEQEKKVNAKQVLAQRKLKQKAKLLSQKKKLQAKKLMKQRNEKVKSLKVESRKKEDKLKMQAAKAKDTLKKIAAAQRQLKKLMNQANKSVTAGKK